MQTTRAGFVVQTTVRWTEPEAKGGAMYQPTRTELRSMLAVLFVAVVVSGLVLLGSIDVCEWIGGKLAGLLP